MDVLKKIMKSKYKWPILIAAALIIIGLVVWLGPAQLLDMFFGDADISVSVDDAQTSAIVTQADDQTTVETYEIEVTKSGKYYDKEHVALYIKTFGCLPSNYITKDEAEKKGWSGGSVEAVAPGCAIGGDYFGNAEGLLPKKSGRKWTECDIDTQGAKSRGSKRIVFSNDGLIYYTDDHYASFTKIYGD